MIQKTEIICYLNKKRSQSVSPKAIDLLAPAIQRSVAIFHQSLPGYHPTPLTKLTQLAQHLGISAVLKSPAVLFAFKIYFYPLPTRALDTTNGCET